MVVTALLGVGLFLYRQRPENCARRLQRAVLAKDVRRIEWATCDDLPLKYFFASYVKDFHGLDELGPTLVVCPSTWTDFFMLRQRVKLKVRYTNRVNDSHSGPDSWYDRELSESFQDDVDMTVGFFGVIHVQDFKHARKSSSSRSASGGSRW